MRRRRHHCQAYKFASVLHFNIKRPVQFYQELFSGFLQSFAGKSLGPLATIVIVKDMNGQSYVGFNGPVEEVEKLLEAADHVVRKEKEKLCSKNS